MPSTLRLPRWSCFTLLCLGQLVTGVRAAQAFSPDVVISQVYGGGGNSGATLRNDFIELFNRGSTPIDLTGWSVQYGPAAASSWQVTALSGTLQPGQHLLVQEAQGDGGSASLPVPDVIGTIAMGAASGVVALSRSTSAFPAGCPLGSQSLVDLVGYGATACAETSAAPTLSSTSAAHRAAGGCVDSDANAADFGAAAPAPRNTAASLVVCGESAPAVVATAPPNGA